MLAKTLLFAATAVLSIMAGAVQFGFARANLTYDSTPAKDHLVMEARDRIRLVAFGDSGTNSAHQYAVAAGIEQRCEHDPIDAILFLGDIAYPHGVDSVDDPKWSTHVFAPYSSACLRSAVFLPVLGNHDYQGNIAAWSQMHAMNPRWNFPARQYLVRFPGLLDIVAVDSKRPFGMRDLIVRSDGTAQPLWSIAIGHHPIVSGSTGPGRHRGGGFRAWWMKRALCASVDAYIAGHAHVMEHIDVAECRMDQYVSGAAGSKLSGLQTPFKHEFAATTFGFLELEIDRTSFTSRFVSADAQVLYEHTVTK